MNYWRHRSKLPANRSSHERKIMRATRHMHWTVEFRVCYVLNVAGPPPAMCSVNRLHQMTSTISHPQLGLIRATSPKANVWTTEPLLIDAFGYVAPIEAWTEGGEPTPQQIAAMVTIHQATAEFRELVAGYMRNQYMQCERPAYRKTIGDPRYSQDLTEADLPELCEPSGIWRLITGILTVIIDQRADLSLEFTTTFDKSHDFAVRFRDGELYEVMMDG
jgi:Domain of unknown function (DUF6985)